MSDASLSAGRESLDILWEGERDTNNDGYVRWAYQHQLLRSEQGNLYWRCNYSSSKRGVGAFAAIFGTRDKVLDAPLVQQENELISATRALTRLLSRGVDPVFAEKLLQAPSYEKGAA